MLWSWCAVTTVPFLDTYANIEMVGPGICYGTQLLIQGLD